MFPYVFLGMVLCFFIGLFAKTVIDNLKNKKYNETPVPITPPTGGGGGKGEGGKDKPKPAV